MERTKEKKKFSLISRLRSTNHAWRGIGILLKTTENAWVHVFFSILAIYLGFVLNISSVEWAILVFTIGLVFITETINTAIEIDMDLTSPNYHPYAKDTKDVAAGAVAMAIVIAGVIGLIIFLPKVVSLI